MAEFLHARVKIDNPWALRALIRAAEILADAAESAPWNQDLPRAQKLLQFAVSHLQLVRPAEARIL